MIDAHKRIHAAKLAMGHSGGDPIAPVARDLAKEAYVLCFDEFQVTDIADAMILRRLLEGLMNHGVVCVITSKCVSRFAWLYLRLIVTQSTSRRSLQEWNSTLKLYTRHRTSQVAL